MAAVSGGSNIVEMLDVVRDPSGNSSFMALVMPKIDAVPFTEAVRKSSLFATRYYMYQLLTALDATH